MLPPAEQYRPPIRRASAKALYVGVFAASALLYLLTCQRTASWQDSGMFQFRVLHLDVRGHLGLALAHPLYITLGWLFQFIPIGEMPGRLNFFSGLGMAVAAANLAVVAMQLTGRRRFALMAAGLLVLSHTGWWLSTIAEVYTWSLAGFTAELWLLLSLLRRPSWQKLAGLMLVNGLGLAVHNFALLPLPVYLAVALLLIRRGRLPAWTLAAAAGSWLVGASLYLGLIVRDIVGGGAVLAVLASALVGEFSQNVLNANMGWNTVRKANFVLMLINVVGPPLLAFVGAGRLARLTNKPVAAAFGAIALIHLLFVARYNVPDQFTFFLPAMAMIYLYAAVGLAAWSAQSRTSRKVVWAMMALWLAALPVFYAAAPAIGRMAGASALGERKLPFRDELRYWLAPWKQNEASAEQFALTALAQVEPQAVIYADATSFYPLAVVQRTHHLRRDVLLAGEDDHSALPPPLLDVHAFLRALDDRPLYVVTPLAPYVPPPLLSALHFENAGVLYRAWVNVATQPNP